MYYLATKGAESEGVEETTLADFTGVGDAFTRPRLRPFVQEDDSGTVDNVGLNTTDVQHLLNLRNPDHIMVGGPPNLCHSTNRAKPNQEKIIIIIYDSFSRVINAR